MARYAGRSSILYPLSLVLLFTLIGCGSPNRANVELRKKIQTSEDQVATLKQLNESQQRMILGLQNSRPTTPTLPSAELEKLYVSYGIKFARLTGGADLDPQKPGDEGLRIYISPMDENGVVIQAAGSFVVEAFDLDLKENNQIGRWEFSPIETKKLWRALLLESTYVLACPWQTPPQHPDITTKVTFTDELTLVSYPIQKVITVELAPSPAPTSQPIR
jgi:hypothetical protein